METPWTYQFEPHQKVVDATYRMVDWIGRYHDHHVSGLDPFPQSGPVLVVTNHSLATYDMPLLAGKILNQKQRLVRCIVDKFVFYIPGCGHLASSVGCINGKRERAAELLKQGEVVMVAPGGMKEALKKHKDKNKVLWAKRKGFVRLALRTGAAVVLAACPAAEDILELQENKLTDFMYQKFRLPLPFAKGYGQTFIPKPVSLTHFLSSPYALPKIDDSDTAAFDKAVDHWHEFLWQEMQQLMQGPLEQSPVEQAKPLAA